MPAACRVCTHPEKEAIDASLCVSSASGRDVARRHGLTEASVRRHRRRHLPKTMLNAEKAQEAARADDLLAQVRELQAKTLSTLLAAERDGDRQTVLRAVREARGNLELLARLLGELDERPVVNLVLSPEWTSVRSVLLAALAPHTEARVAVAAALAGLENGHGTGG
jgi:transposase-like protein